MKPLTSKQIVLFNALAVAVGVVPLFLWQLPHVWPAIPSDHLPLRPMSLFAQWLAVIVGFGVKPVYVVLSLVLVIWLWRQRARDLAMLRWGLIWFWFGENACTVNFLFFGGGCDFWEYLHNYGMAAGFAMITYAFLEGFDGRVIKFSPQKERCAALGLCPACHKHTDAPCGLKRLFTALIPAVAVLALIPLPAGFMLTSYNTNILGSLYNYSHLMSAQLFELRFCPALAIVLLTAAWLVLLFKRQEPVAMSKALFAAGMGPLSFGLLRLFLVFTFGNDLMWFETWEEVTELIFVVAVAVVLWVFRERLFVREEAAAQMERAVG
ncbi:MAG: hypothetical protein NTW03_18605 [Verrucomicrobia bacterium]|nr:hypothetical protein [Verrucomicrobiota bacterium]